MSCGHGTRKIPCCMEKETDGEVSIFQECKSPHLRWPDDIRERRSPRLSVRPEANNLCLASGLYSNPRLFSQRGFHLLRQRGIWQLSSLRIKNREVSQPVLLQLKLQSGVQDTEAVFDAALEVNRRCLGEILRGARNFADAKTKMNALREHLAVEDKIIRVFKQRKFFQDSPAERAIAGVIFGQFRAKEKILDRRQTAIGNVFVARHSARQRGSAEYARPQHHIVDIVGKHAGH